MLQTQTVAKSTLELLRRLLDMPELASFALVGGTNLSLRFGHRISVDLDIFTAESFDLEELRQTIRNEFPDSLELTARKQILLLMIEGVKTDLIRHNYPLLEPVEIIEGLRFMSLPDVIAMKLGAIAGRGAKKDFWDINKLLETFTLQEMIAFFVKKYPNSDPGQVLRSLVYFKDADEQPDPEDLQNIFWAYVKEQITQSVKSYAAGLIS